MSGPRNLVDGVPLPREGAAGRLSDDRILEHFLDWVIEQGFDLPSGDGEPIAAEIDARLLDQSA